MNTKELNYLDKGYATLPYFIIRITSGIYMQVPIQINCDLRPREGISITINPKDDIDSMKKVCIEVLKGLLMGRVATSNKCYPKLNFLLKKTLTGCLVLDPDSAFYVKENGAVTKGKPPKGGAVITMRSEMIIFPNNNHYILL